jgi:histidine triad (HIT) family protein
MRVADCVFCEIIAGTRAAHIVVDDTDVVAFLDARPVFKGHVLVVTRAHVTALPELPDSLVVPVFTTVRHLAQVMPKAYDCQGTFVATNSAVSQSVPHLHVHVVPRTKGDGLRGFFWPRTRYASESEAAQYAQRLRDAL